MHYMCQCSVVLLSYHHTSHFPLHSIEINLFSSRQEGGELADDVMSPPHSGHQLPVPALPVGGA